MKKAELIFIPAVGMGHLVSMVEMAKLLVDRDHRLSITILIMKLSLDAKINTYTQSLASSSISDRIKLIHLPNHTIDDQINPNSFSTSFVETQKIHVKEAVTNLTHTASTSPLAGFVVDMYCTTMIDVANDFQLPTYLFYTSGAAFLGLMFHLQTLHDHHDVDIAQLKDSNTELLIPSFVNPFPSKVLPSRVLDKDGAQWLLNCSRRFRETKGILVNTFMELESHALHFLSNDKSETTPPVYSVGPILNLKGSDKTQEVSDMMSWLDDQPPSSVVFLCFGSMGSFGEDQVKEIACALEQSGVRFLWSLRQPPPVGKVQAPTDYANHKDILPEGFLDRTVGIGKIIGWAPQVDVLAHSAIGGFVSHCGWNSTLESLWFGIPIAAWPLYAEQQSNAFQLVRELGLAVEIKIDYRRDFKGEHQMVVMATEIQRGIKEVMEGNSEIRKKVKKIKEMSRKALMDGGSSSIQLRRFIDNVMDNVA